MPNAPATVLGLLRIPADVCMICTEEEKYPRLLYNCPEEGQRPLEWGSANQLREYLDTIESRTKLARWLSETASRLSTMLST